MMQYCYLCNQAGSNWPTNLREIKSKHSNTPVIVFIEKFLGSFFSKRNIRDESNCLCSDCLSQIYAYDWSLENVKRQETNLRGILIKTETDIAASVIKIEDDDNNGFVNEIKPERPKVNTVKSSKPIIIRVVKRVPFLKSKPPTVPVQDIKPQISRPSNLIPIPVPNSGLQRKVIKVKPQVCNYCDAKFRHFESLQNHLKLHTKSPGVITCHICTYQMSISDEEAFKNHVKKHDKATPMKCVICDVYQADDNLELKQHVQKKHITANILLCDICGKTFVSAVGLRKHYQCHEDDKLFQCTFCDKNFKSKATLNRHIKNHTQTETYSCSFCDKKFRRVDNLHMHEKRHRGETKIIKCTLCDAAFETKSDLQAHLQRKHNAEIPHEKITNKIPLI